MKLLQFTMANNSNFIVMSVNALFKMIPNIVLLVIAAAQTLITTANGSTIVSEERTMLISVS